MNLRSVLPALALLGAAIGGCVLPGRPALASGPAAPIQIGVYYFPGWSPNLPDAAYPDPWAPIAKYPDRIPLIGRYDNASPAVLRKQLDAMNEGKIAFVAFDVFNLAHGVDRLPQALDAYMAVARPGDPKFTMLWDNHDQYIASMQDWDTLVTTWIRHYMSDPRYLRVDHKPVVIVFSPGNLDVRAATFGSTGQAMLSHAQDVARRLGLPGIAFVAGSGPQHDLISTTAAAEGYAALTDYNMGTSDYTMAGTGYQRRIAVYRQYWQVYKRSATLPVILPMTVGWDRSPWGGSKEDGAMSTPAEFRQHVVDAVEILSQGTDPFSRMGVICCWNEFGEGSILEPNVRYGDAHVRALGSVLSDMPKSEH